MKYDNKKNFGREERTFSKGGRYEKSFSSKPGYKGKKDGFKSFDSKPKFERKFDNRNKTEFEPKENRFEHRDDENMPENILEGRNPIREAIKAGRSIEKILVAQGEIEGSVKEIVYKAKELGAIVQEVERTRLDHMSLTGAHQGIIAVVAVKEYCTVEDILEYAKQKGEKPFIVILDGICDPQNLGAIIRSAECAGVHGVIIPSRRAVGLTPIVAKCSAGAIEYMRVAKVTNISQTIEKLKKANVWVYGASMEGQQYTKARLDGAVALVVGAEGEGLSQLVKKNCDELVSIPQNGKIDSLNASVATGILIYEALRQRG